MEQFKKDIWRPALLFMIFLAFSLPGIEWGVPALWNPDELVWRVDSALRGELVFDETEPDYNYPSLPKYIMYGIGKIVYGLGFSSSKFIIVARGISAFLGAVSAVLIYFTALSTGLSSTYSMLACGIFIGSGLAVENSRYAHNDLYLQFFSILCVYASMQYYFTRKILWVFASFICVGLSASSKYTGGSLILVPIIMILLLSWHEIRWKWIQVGVYGLIGGGLSFLGYAIGTPKALLLGEYFSKVIPALQRYPQYGFNSGMPIGLFGQWNTFKSGVGNFIYYIFILALIWSFIRLVLHIFGKMTMDFQRLKSTVVLLIVVLIFDLPFLISVNYIPRYFIPFVPFLSVLASFFAFDLYSIFKDCKYGLAGMSTILLLGGIYSVLRLVGVALLFMNDARIPATDYIASFRGYKKTIEYTLYPPYINKKQFYGAARNYPIYFVKYPDDVVPSGGRYEYNQGEQGLIDRNVDYFVIDSFTYGRFSTPSICRSSPVECDFFEKLLTGESTTFRLLAKFSYTLPPIFPDLKVRGVNPDILIYERIR